MNTCYKQSHFSLPYSPIHPAVHSFTLSLTLSLFHLSTQKNLARSIVLWLTHSLISQKSPSLAFARPVTFVDENNNIMSKMLNDWNVVIFFSVPDHTGVVNVLRPDSVLQTSSFHTICYVSFIIIILFNVVELILLIYRHLKLKLS